MNSTIKPAMNKMCGLKHSYLVNGAWCRCECGHEILEIIQCDFDYPDKYEYQIRCFGGHIGNEEDTWHSCYVADKNEIKQIVSVLENHAFSFERIEDHKSQYWFKVEHDRDDGFESWVSFFMEKRRKKKKNKCLWECILTPETCLEFAKELKKMIKEEEAKYGKVC